MLDPIDPGAASVPETRDAGEPGGEISALAETIATLSAKLDDVSVGFDKYRKQTNDDLKRLRRRDAVETDESSTISQPPSSGGEDFASMMRLQRALVGLPDDLASDILDRLTDGDSSAQALREVEAIKKGMAHGPEIGKSAATAGGNGTNQKPPRDDAQNAPRQNSTPRPTNRREWAKLAKNDRAAAQILLRDDTFALEALPP